MKKLSCIALAGVLLMTTICGVSATTVPEKSTISQTMTESVSSSGGYRKYRQNYMNADQPQTAVEVPLTNATGADGKAPLYAKNADGSLTAVQVEDGESVTLTAQVPASGLYQIHVSYQALTGKDIDILCALYIDGQLPFSSAAGLTMTRAWKDSNEQSYSDDQGNEYRPCLLYTSPSPRD